MAGDSLKNISWKYVGYSFDLNVEFSSDGGINWKTLKSTDSLTSFKVTNWVIPDVESDQCLIKLTHKTDPSVSDVSDNFFSIVPTFNEIPSTMLNIPIKWTLSQNYPNPFNPTTTFRYDIPRESNVTLTLFDLNGRQIEILVNEKQQPGYYKISWDASQFSSGVYIYRIQADGFSAVKKCILMK